eukprot:m.330826 g.330826  ORF g.330826 m.330826 type:complete len:109 (+) comp55612_c3_seq4:594-920(+)
MLALLLSLSPFMWLRCFFFFADLNASSVSRELVRTTTIWSSNCLGRPIFGGVFCRISAAPCRWIRLLSILRVPFSLVSFSSLSLFFIVYVFGGSHQSNTKKQFSSRQS